MNEFESGDYLGSEKKGSIVSPSFPRACIEKRLEIVFSSGSGAGCHRSSVPRKNVN